MIMMMISVFLSRRYFQEEVDACAHAFNAHHKMMVFLTVFLPSCVAFSATSLIDEEKKTTR